MMTHTCLIFSLVTIGYYKKLNKDVAAVRIQTNQF